MKKIALIDGDPMVYIIGHNLVKDMPEYPASYIAEKYHSLVTWIAMQTNSTHVRIAWSSKHIFRDEVYLAAPYKGNRGDKPAFVATTEPSLLEQETYASYCVHGLEADDLLSVWAEQCRSLGIDYVVASPDKDMDQIVGERFKYDKNALYTIEPEQALYCLNTQMLMGDSTDNVLGIPGMGEVKAAKFVKEHGMMAPTAILNAYIKHFGPYYGPLVHDQTRQTIYMLTTNHPQYSRFAEAVAYSNFTETEVISTEMLNPFPNAGI